MLHTPQLLQLYQTLYFHSHLLTLQCCNAALLGVLTATIFEFHKVSPDAANLLLPYLGWSTFAAVLTLDIWRRNPQVTYTTNVTIALTSSQLITWCTCLASPDGLQYMLQWYAIGGSAMSRDSEVAEKKRKFHKAVHVSKCLCQRSMAEAS